MVDGWSWCWRLRESGLCCVQLAVLLTTHRGSYQWLSLMAIKENPLSRHHHWLPVIFINSNQGNPLSRHHHWNLDRYWSGSNLPVAFIHSDQGKPTLTPTTLEYGSRCRRRADVTKWPGRSYKNDDADVGIDDDLMLTWCLERSRVEIMWVDHVSGHVSRSCDW